MATAHQGRERTFRRDGETRSPETHDFENLCRINTRRSVDLVQDAECGVTRGELFDGAMMLEITESSNAEGFAALEMPGFGRDDAPCEADLETTRELRFFGVKAPKTCQEATSARQAKHGADVGKHEAIGR